MPVKLLKIAPEHVWMQLQHPSAAISLFPLLYRLKSSIIIFILFIYVFSWLFITQDWTMSPVYGG